MTVSFLELKRTFHPLFDTAQIILILNRRKAVPFP